LKADPLFAITIPSKTQAYLASGKPIIMAVEGDAADMVKDAEAGVCIKPEDAEGLAKAMIAVSQMSPETLLRMGEAGKAYYEKFLRLEVGVRSFDSVFKKVLGRTSSGEQGR
jgi:colanic acid biosynthesis glycosyl transferase WcaI